MQSINDTKLKFNIHLKQASPHKYGSSQSLKIFCGVRGFHHTRNNRRAYFLVIEKSGKRVDGRDFLLSRSVTHVQALQFAKIQAENWQTKANRPDAVIICLRPDFTQGRVA